MSTVSPPIHDLVEFYCGDDWEIDGVLEDSSGTVLNLTGATISWHLDDARRLTNFLTEASSGITITITDAVNGLIVISIDKTQTALLRPDTYWDKLSVTLGGKVLTEWAGPIRAKAK